jgi:hypothetical protein
MSTTKAPPNEVRTVISQGVIALMACVGGYMFLVDPLSNKLAAARAEEESIASRARAADSLRDSVPQITAAVARARAEAERIHQTGRLARQEQELYATLTSVANECKVRIDQMTPNKILTAAKAGQNAQTAPDSLEGGPNAATGYTIDATATFSDLAMFLKAIRTDLGYSIIKSVRMTPSSDTRRKTVHAFIETEHFAFDAAPIELGPPTAEQGSAAAGAGGNQE